ncbi:MAG: bifunctional phosphopantothenoylcysteine decarboxylase/phosphopantothenate--cysteine ligase CoaBC [archaeon]|nr:bifunctional phosphopantothenoylcysteine decarboxylase/phosphopantothenate--cysteine ligase CoaBC [archaeon]
MYSINPIYCEKSRKLEGKTIVIGITGSIAASECFTTIRELIRNGATVIPVMTQSAMNFVTPLSMEYASGNKSITELTGESEHINIINLADIYIIYPATANTISKIANGINDTTVTSMATVALGSNIPVVIAPAMHNTMFVNPAIQKNIEELKKYGVTFVGPKIEKSKAKIVSRETLMATILRLTSNNDLKSKKILIIGGRSSESIDSMRVITNRSTGLMAVELAKCAFERGADVKLWMGDCSVSLPDFISTERFDTVSELAEMCEKINYDIVIVPAALSDFSPSRKVEGKVSSNSEIELILNPLPKILPIICKKCKNVIGFKAESELTDSELVNRSKLKLAEYGLSAIVANDVSSVGKTSTSVIIVTKNFSKNISGTKVDIANAIMDFYLEKL